MFLEIQWTSEYWTSPVFKWSISDTNYVQILNGLKDHSHLNTGTVFRPQYIEEHRLVRFANGHLVLAIQIHWGSEIRTSPDFEWSILAGTGHLNTGWLENQTHFIGPVRFSNGTTKLDRFTIKLAVKRSSLVVLFVRTTIWVPVRFSNG